VFVHGLFGGPEKTWSAPVETNDESSQSVVAVPELEDTGARKTKLGKTDGHSSTRESRASTKHKPTFWPRDILPQFIPNIRIYTWGYDADIDGFASASQNNVRQHATNLVADLADLRDTLKDVRSSLLPRTIRASLLKHSIANTLEVDLAIYFRRA
jgi:hypothetical protein